MTLLKDDIKNKHKLIDSILEHNSNLIQALYAFAKKNVIRKTNDKSISHTTGNNAFRNDKKNDSNVPKDDRLKELQVSFKELHPEAHQPKVEKKNIVDIGDSMIKNVNRRDVSRGDSVKIRPHPGASTEDLTAHIKPAIRKNPDIVVIHTGTNDLQNNCNIV